MDGEIVNAERRKNSSIGALLAARSQDQDDSGNVSPPPPRKKSSILDDLVGDQGFDFNSMGTMGTFAGWGFSNEDEEDTKEEDNRGRNNRGRGGRDNRRGGRGRDDDDDNRGGRRGRGRDDDDDDRGGRGGRNDNQNKRPGDWNCSECDFSNFRDRNECYKCKAPKSGGGSSDLGRGGDRGQQDMSSGDWECNQCGFSNFRAKTECYECKTPKMGGGGGGAGGRGRYAGGNRGDSDGQRGRRNSDSFSDNNAPVRGSGYNDEPRYQVEEPEPKKAKFENKEDNLTAMESLWGGSQMTNWTDIKEFDEDHDPQQLLEENEYLEKKYGANTVKVRYTPQGVLGYYCQLCDSTITGETQLLAHCNGKNHKKKKERRDNPQPEVEIRAEKKRGGGGGAGGGAQRQRLLPPEAFGGPKDNERGGRDNFGRGDDDYNRGSRFDQDAYGRGARNDLDNYGRGARNDLDNYGRGARNDLDNYGRGGRNDQDMYGRGGRNDQDMYGRGGRNDQDNYGGRGGRNNSFGRGAGGNNNWNNGQARSAPQGGADASGLTGGPSGALLTKLADCSVKSEGDAELATNVVGLLLKSLKDYSLKNGDSKVAELLLQAELKMSTVKALKVGLQYLSNSNSGASAGDSVSGGGGGGGGYNTSNFGGGMGAKRDSIGGRGFMSGGGKDEFGRDLDLRSAARTSLGGRDSMGGMGGRDSMGGMGGRDSMGGMGGRMGRDSY